MAFTYGFYDSIDGDRVYSSSQFSNLFNGIINDGVFQNIGSALTVSAPSNGMYVIVGTGRAWLDGTWAEVDSAYPLPRDDSDQIYDIKPDPTFERIDVVYLEVNHSTDVRASYLKYEYGKAASVPQKPVLVNTDNVKYYPLAYITIPKAGDDRIANGIKDSMIENMVGRESAGGPPFITGILRTLDATELTQQWKGEFEDWTENNTFLFNAWWDSIKKIVNGESIVSYATKDDFPAVGDSNVLYLAEDVKKIYRWNGNSYIEISDATDPAEVVGNLASTVIDLSARVVNLETEVSDMKRAIPIELTPGSAGWQPSGSYYIQDYRITGMRDTDTPMVERLIPDDLSVDDLDKYEEQCNYVTKFETYNGGIRAYCYDSTSLPDMTLKFIVKGR